jgi:ABC-2 type transport system ATP-binding protein
MYVTEQISLEAAVHKLAPAAPAVQEVALVDVSNLLVQHDKGFSLRIPQLQMFPGDMLAVLGANGSGKSTLLSCLFGRGASFSGSVQLLGQQQPGQLPLAHRHRLGVQWLGAGFNELYRVREIQELHHRCYGRSDASVFEAFGLPELGNRRFGRLSSGEQQRVQLAMALAHHPDLVILDEPTSNLDPHYEDMLCRTLQQRHRAEPGFAALFVTHSSRVATLCERVLLLDKGGIDEMGTLQALVSKRFGRMGCRIVGQTAQLDAAEVAFAGSDAVLNQHRSAHALTVYGAPSLRELAQAFLAKHEVEHFSLWRPGAADLLEGIKNV